MSEWFRKFSHAAARVTGTAGAFLIALAVILAWAVTGPIFGFSDTWQLVINTGTTIVTFLMVFLIQNTQNRDSQALHAKLDELLIHIRGADNHLVEAEELSDQELRELMQHIRDVAKSLKKRETPREETAPSGATVNGNAAARRASKPNTSASGKR